MHFIVFTYISILLCSICAKVVEKDSLNGPGQTTAGKCQNCDESCTKICEGNLKVNEENINCFKDCTVINGDLFIASDSFTNMHPDRLEVFSTLKQLNGILIITANNVNFTSLHYFRQLEIINNENPYEYSLYIENTNLSTLETVSLKRIKGSLGVHIRGNKQMCFVEGINWLNIIDNQGSLTKVYDNKRQKHCSEDDQICDPQCDYNGCWGTGPQKCVKCRNFKSGKTCLEQEIFSVRSDMVNNSRAIPCPENQYDNNGECISCHNQCKFGCVGAGPTHCTGCKKFKDGLACVASCPTNKYKDGHFCVESCPITKYEEQGECKSCNEECESSCSGRGSTNCHECKHFKYNSACVATCPPNTYLESRTCKPCHENCIQGCSGPSMLYGITGCNYCRKIIMIDDVIVCLHFDKPCPPGYSNVTITSQNNAFKPLLGETLCRKCSSDFDCNENQHTSLNKTAVIIVSGIVAVSIVVISLFILCLWFSLKRKRYVLNSNRRDLLEPLHEKQRPNLSQIMTIKESEIYRYKSCGCGAFGTVYQGIWKTNGCKIPIAMKILHKNDNINDTKKFLDEAAVMASMDHPNVLHLIGICITSDVMIITQFMPLGSLLDYIRKNKNHIGEKILLSWCKQIANGMAYLEHKRLVHRDLAARNVLLQTIDCVKITDFGLSKFTDVNDNQFITEGGILPIKWLAPECIESGLFTHKSDVWAFGITIWELLTFGAEPFANICSAEFLRQIKLGEKLPQPPICSTHVYILLIRCWLLRPELRPNFEELQNSFEKMNYDPERYLDKFGGERATLLPQSIYRSSIDIKSSSNRNSALSVSVHSKLQVEIRSKLQYYEGGYLIPISSSSRVFPDEEYDTITNSPFYETIK